MTCLSTPRPTTATSRARAIASPATVSGALTANARRSAGRGSRVSRRGRVLDVTSADDMGDSPLALTTRIHTCCYHLIPYHLRLLAPGAGRAPSDHATPDHAAPA